MDRQRATHEELKRFFAVKSLRATRATLKRLQVPAKGGTVPWRLVLNAMHLDHELSDEKFRDLTRPLMLPCDVAALKQVDDETIYRWHRESAGLPQPVSIGSRGLRWIRAEIEAWEGLRDATNFPRLTKQPTPFGALKPTISGHP